jgi:hypothetical protein
VLTPVCSGKNTSSFALVTHPSGRPVSYPRGRTSCLLIGDGDGDGDGAGHRPRHEAAFGRLATALVRFAHSVGVWGRPGCVAARRRHPAAALDPSVVATRGPAAVSNTCQTSGAGLDGRHRTNGHEQAHHHAHGEPDRDHGGLGHRPHNPKVAGSNPAPATKKKQVRRSLPRGVSAAMRSSP